MSKQKHREKEKQRPFVRQRGGQHTSSAQIPLEMADQLPPGTTVTHVVLTQAEIYALAQRVEPEVTQWLAEKPAKNPLEALLLMVQAIYALLQPPELPIPHKELVELAQMLAQGYDFAATWPYTREQLLAAMTPNHPDLRPDDVPDEHILYVARQVEQRLLVQMANESVALRDATQAGMLVVTMTHKILFDESPIFGADHHEMSHIARVLIDAHTFHPDWPYRDQVKAALAACFHFQK